MNSPNAVPQATSLALSRPDEPKSTQDVASSTGTDTGVDESLKAQSLAVKAIQKHYCTDFLDAASALQSICNVQDTSISLIESKTKFLAEIRESYQLEEIIDEAQRYYSKLIRIRKEMAALSKKSKELTRRAAQVKAVREKAKIKKEQERERLERLEQDIAPRYASDLTS